MTKLYSPVKGPHLTQSGHSNGMWLLLDHRAPAFTAVCTARFIARRKTVAASNPALPVFVKRGRDTARAQCDDDASRAAMCAEQCRVRIALHGKRRELGRLRNKRRKPFPIVDAGEPAPERTLAPVERSRDACKRLGHRGLDGLPGGFDS